MTGTFYEIEQAARVLGLSVEELEEMVSAEELPMVKVGERRRLIRVREVEAVLERVKNGGRLRTKRLFSAEYVEKAAQDAARSLGIPVDDLSYKIVDRGTPWAFGGRAKPARILVDLPEKSDDEEEVVEEPPSRGRPEIRQDFRVDRPSRHKPVEDEAAAEPSNAEDEEAGRGGEDRADDEAGCYFAPEQVARMLGVDRYEVNRWIYSKKLAWVTINDYLWVPVESVEDLAKELSPPALEDPPKPFKIVVPQDEAQANAANPRLGRNQLTRKEDPTTSGQSPSREETLAKKVAELEEHVETLQRELRLERSLRSRPPDTGLIAEPGSPATQNGRDVHRHDAEPEDVPLGASDPEVRVDGDPGKVAGDA